jgi:hypothetical protein
VNGRSTLRGYLRGHAVVAARTEPSGVPDPLTARARLIRACFIGLDRTPHVTTQEAEQSAHRSPLRSAGEIDVRRVAVVSRAHGA